ncbi:probable serine/threonine-protein kinase drkD [Penaeus japonicus]|uniref:probable serine/threonine-protein kinase drkD n=1 Tax=Penaeus japonicus TaxID=27405 RepID=UPI001C7163C4|nr:probable serine/threonine-protein kinase drkD [Penaeus japonicus]
MIRIDTKVANLSSKECKFLLKGKEVRLGKGTYGRVLRVSYKGKECALKVAAPGSKVLFREEMEMLKKLQGAGGAPLPLAYSEEPSCLMMTYLGKDCLADVLSAQRSNKQLLDISVKLAEAVAAVHAAGFVHCDLKPTNVMVQLRGAAGAPSVHIIDFGLALPAGQCHPKSNKGRQSWYCDCVSEGTPLTEQCDVLGLGVMLQFVLECMTAPPAGLQALVERAQRPEHDARPTVQEMAEALGKMLRLCQ